MEAGEIVRQKTDLKLGEIKLLTDWIIFDCFDFGINENFTLKSSNLILAIVDNSFIHFIIWVGLTFLRKSEVVPSKAISK
jgi:hypothetical protein